jgi:general secretion pathway protein C
MVAWRLLFRPTVEIVLQRYSWVGTALAAVLGSYLAARIVNTVAATAIAPKPALLQQSVGAAPQSAQISPRIELDAARMAKTFDLPLPKPPSEAGAEEAPSAKAWNPMPVRSTLRAGLVGTALANPTRYSLCQLTNGDSNETLVYGIGDKFMGARIYAVEKERVLLDNEGHNEYIDNSAAAAPNLGIAPMPQPGQPMAAQTDASVRQLSENQYVLAKTTVNGALSDLSNLATQARIVPSFKNGVANGFKLFSIVPDSLYAKIGIQNGDVIRRINGYEMNSPDKALEIYQKLRDANRIEVEIERRGETIRKSYSIE